MIEFHCQNDLCNFTKLIADKHVGKKAKCPKCGMSTRIEASVEDFGSADVPDVNLAHSNTFGFRQFYLGMEKDDFLDSNDFDDSLPASSWDVGLESYEALKFEPWLDGEDRVEWFHWSSEELSFLNWPLGHTIFEFIDDRLHQISLETIALATEARLDMLSDLRDCLGHDDHEQDVAGFYISNTWERSEGHLALVCGADFEATVEIRLTNQLSLEEANAIQPPPMLVEDDSLEVPDYGDAYPGSDPMASNTEDSEGEKTITKKDMTSQVHRLDAFEERLGVRIEALSAFEVEDKYSDEAKITVRGELHTNDGTSLGHDISLEVSVFDEDGRVVQTGRDWIDSDSFFGFHTFEISCYVAPGIATKIRMVPKPS